MFTKKWFLDLDRRLRDAGLDSDSASFDEIKSNLQNRKILGPDEFASAVAYVILAGGFSQKTAKIKHGEIIKYLEKAGKNANQADMLAIFNNKNKMAAILKIWQNRAAYRDGYYALSDFDAKLKYLSSLPHIGTITANHLARNLGENVVKYDIWIQRLGVAFAQRTQGTRNPPSPRLRRAGGNREQNLESKINNGALDADVRRACDDMFAHLERETGLPRGYIDVVLWKAAQNKLIGNLI
ncbi:MAG: hypothetical protein LBJ73_01340 [Rickettsiales bacterium]|jgi:hypothetical protein|nr:hypothetical protein [Rickettsiales bacterium]